MRIKAFSGVLVATTLASTAVLAIEVETTASLPGRQDMSSSTRWVGFAASPNGRVFRANGVSEAVVRSNVRSECEQTSGSTCRTLIVPVQWDVVALRCGGRAAFFGGSGPGEGNASWIASEKARQSGYSDSQCKQIFSY
jgi:hypothetical protein